MKINFILPLLLTGIFFSCSSSKNLKKGDPIFTAPLGVQTYSFRNYFPKNLVETLDKVHQMGFKEVEVFSRTIPPEELKKLCDARGLTIPSTMVGFELLQDNPKEVIELANTLGAKYVSCAWIPHDFGNFGLEDAQKAIKVFNEAGKILAENNLTFAYHPHGYEFKSYQEGNLLDYIIKNTNPNYVAFEMDTYWIHFGGGNPVEWLKKYPNRWKLMHLKDMKKGTEKNLTGNSPVDTNVPLGQGELDFPSILKTAKEVGVLHYFIEDESDAVMGQVPQSVAYLQSLMN